MMAYVFPGQASQFPGMGKDLFESSSEAQKLFQQADDILGFSISDVMFNGTEEDLKKTEVTQPAVFLHSVITALIKSDTQPDAVAGHSLGEFSALVANGTLSFEDGLSLVKARADAMQKACDANPSTMAAIVGLDDKVVEEVCRGIDKVVVPANYNCPGQLVISGEIEAVELACEKLSKVGARRAIKLAVGGAFHSPLMQPAQDDLSTAIEATKFNAPRCPIYQNVDGLPQTDPSLIQQNLVKQLTSPVRWSETIQNMITDGVEAFVEIGGTGKVLQGMIKRISRETQTMNL